MSQEQYLFLRLLSRFASRTLCHDVDGNMLLLIEVDENQNNGSSTKCLGIISPDSDLIVRGNRRSRFPLPVFDAIRKMLAPDEDPARKQILIK